MLDRDRFNEEFEWFRRLIPRWDEGRAFTSFDEGVVERWEGYKPRVRRRARDILASPAWTEAEIGSGTILQRTIEAVEIKENNLVTWQDRRGPGSSDHRVLLDARRDANLRLELERRLFDLFKGVADESATFGLLKDALGAKYPLLAYLFFLKDMRRFMPIRPTRFDSALTLGSTWLRRVSVVDPTHQIRQRRPRPWDRPGRTTNASTPRFGRCDAHSL